MTRSPATAKVRVRRPPGRRRAKGATRCLHGRTAATTVGSASPRTTTRPSSSTTSTPKAIASRRTTPRSPSSVLACGTPTTTNPRRSARRRSCRTTDRPKRSAGRPRATLPTRVNADRGSVAGVMLATDPIEELTAAAADAAESGHVAESERLAAEAVDLAERLALGPERDRAVAGALRQLGTALRSRGRLAAAEQAFELALSSA